MKEQGTLPIGLEVGGRYYREFTLEEHQFGHTLAIMHDPAVDAKRLKDEAYYDACLFARRLQVQGVEEITPEMILGMQGADGHALINAAGELEQRRKAFRDAAGAAEGKAGSAAQDGGGVEGD